MIGSMMMAMSALLLLTGTVGGIVMGIQHNFLLAPAHAHLNLVGGVLLFLFGLYYRLVPDAAASRLAKVQAALHMLGAVAFPGGLALMLLYGDGWIAAPIAGSLVVVAGFALFCVVVLRTALRERADGFAAQRQPSQLQPYPWHSQGRDSRRQGASTT